MILRRGFTTPPDWRGGFVAIGNLDGVHLGHRQIVAAVVSRAKENHVPAVVLTFEPHPIHILRPEFAPPSLMTLQRKTETLAALGVDFVIAYPTDQTLLAMDPDEFFAEIIQNKLAACGLVEGPNFFFGRNRAGDVNTLRTLCDAADITLKVVEPVKSDEGIVSSSRIRKLLSEGSIESAANLLGDHYSIAGTVRHGAGRGREIGFPTANLTEIPTLIPNDGVYAASAVINEESFAVALNIGPNPTFGEASRKVEAHVLDFTGELYGQSLEVRFLARLRAGRKFSSAEELTDQIEQDITQTREVYLSHNSRD